MFSVGFLMYTEYWCCVIVESCASVTRTTVVCIPRRRISPVFSAHRMDWSYRSKKERVAAVTSTAISSLHLQHSNMPNAREMVSRAAVWSANGAKSQKVNCLVVLTCLNPSQEYDMVISTIPSMDNQ